MAADTRRLHRIMPSPKQRATKHRIRRFIPVNPSVILPRHLQNRVSNRHASQPRYTFDGTEPSEPTRLPSAAVRRRLPPRSPRRRPWALPFVSETFRVAEAPMPAPGTSSFAVKNLETQHPAVTREAGCNTWLRGTRITDVFQKRREVAASF